MACLLIKGIKVLEMIPSVKFAFGTVAVLNMRSEEALMQVKEAIV